MYQYPEKFSKMITMNLMFIAYCAKISYLLPKSFLALSYVGRINSPVVFGTFYLPLERTKE
jgi:hypothetical protein